MGAAACRDNFWSPGTGISGGCVAVRHRCPELDASPLQELSHLSSLLYKVCYKPLLPLKLADTKTGQINRGATLHMSK